jgi:hypothetical protein
MQKAVGMMLLVIGTSVTAMAAITPEIDASSAGSALALISGALLIYKGRRK